MEIKNNQIYNWKVLSDLLKEQGINHNLWSIKNYEKDKLVKFGRVPRTGERIIMGKEIKRAIKRIRKSLKV